MSTDYTNPAATTAAATASMEDAVQRIRELNERVLNSAKSAGKVTLDAYEKSLQTLVDFEERAANATQLDWVSTIAAAHAKFIQDVSAAYVNAAREMLK